MLLLTPESQPIMPELRLMVVTAPGPPREELAIAACRAGVPGVVDLEYAPDVDGALTTLARLRRFTSAPFGAKLAADREAICRAVLRAEGARPDLVLLAGGEQAERERWATEFRAFGVHVLVEAVSLEEALLAERVGAAGVVLKGHEAAGHVGSESTFILLQRCAGRVNLPLWVEGGAGLSSAGAPLAAGAAGIVLQGQVLLASESPLPDQWRRRLRAFDGSQTILLGESLGWAVRCYHAPGLRGVEQLRQLEEQLAAAELAPAEKQRRWREAVVRLVAAGAEEGIWLLGQDAATAAPMAERYVTVSGTIEAVRLSAQDHWRAACRTRPFEQGSALAQSHGTRFPVVQGPMTRVSDRPEFAHAVARAGGLPLLALALMRGEQVRRLLQQTAALLGDRSWGVGLLGFSPSELRAEQLEAVRAVWPRFALIAGGRADQARELEAEGIATYLHVPSPELLRVFLGQGVRRFVFEGRECGGHVGPRTSLVLWDAMCGLLLDHIAKHGAAEEIHVLLAGGIHDELSAAMAAAVVGPLAERGARVGLLMGSAYLFTPEAVQTGAIVPRFQQELLSAERTVLLKTGPGHEVRVLPTAYAETFQRHRRRLCAEGHRGDELRRLLEQINVGRLRIAAKGVQRAGSSGSEPPRPGPASSSSAADSGQPAAELVPVPEERQLAEGLYMIGQVAPLHREIVSMDQLHQQVCNGGTQRLLARGQPQSTAEGMPEHIETQSQGADRPPSAGRPDDIAIIGIACHYPKAGSLRAYWRNILACRDAVTEVPLDHWDWRLYFQEQPEPGRITSKWGGFLDDIPFDPLRYGMPPATLDSIEPLQLMLLEAVREALGDAGYSRRPFERERTCVVLGAGGGAAQRSMAYALQAYLPLLETVPGLEGRAQEILEKCKERLPQWTEDTFPGILLNVAAGRVANRFDLGGSCFSVDAACGSSLAAVYLATRELQSGASDMAVVMGGDTVQNPFTYMLFSGTNTFSRRGRCRPFDRDADGIVISEGVGVVVLKRLSDAQRDGDRIYAVIKGVGSSSDGKGLGLTAPRPEGQERALRRAYEAAGVSPARVGYWEAHGTGTVAGDRSEVASAGRLLSEHGAEQRCCALGSVKSMIGHTKCAAGLAGLISATMALHHKIRPPLLVNQPNPKADFEHSPFFLNTKARPWVHGKPEPRCAAVSAFGFGGTNFHAVLEEYTGEFLGRPCAGSDAWPAELFVFRCASRQALSDEVHACREALAAGARPDPADLAASLWHACSPRASDPVLAMVAASLDELAERLDRALAILEGDQPAAADPRGIYFVERPSASGGKLAVLFPGQGTQYPDMLAQLGMAFPVVRRTFDEAEAVLMGELESPLGSLIYPPSPFSAEEEQAASEALARADVAQPAVGAAAVAVWRVLQEFGLKADCFAGHSYGDLVALAAAGAMELGELIHLSWQRGRVMRQLSAKGTMLAVDAGADECRQALAGAEGVTLANFNAPHQTVISGTDQALEAARAALERQGLRSRLLDVRGAFHSPQMARAAEAWREVLAQFPLRAPSAGAFSNTTAAEFPDEPAAIAELLVRHMTSPVRFADEIEALYREGVRVFVEVGPQGVLTGLIGQILGDRPHLAAASNRRGRDDLVQLEHLLAQLLAHGQELSLDLLFAGRQVQVFPLSELVQQTGRPQYSPTTWLVNSVRVRRWNEPEPCVFGQAKTEAAETPGVESVAGLPSAGGQDPGGINPPARPANDLAQPSGPAEDLTELSAPAEGPDPAEALGLPELPAAPGLLPADAHQAAEVMMRFQDLMSQFLRTQQAVMERYLGADGHTVSDSPAAARSGALPAAAESRPSVPVTVQPAPATAPLPEAPPEAQADAATDGQLPERTQLPEPATTDSPAPGPTAGQPAAHTPAEPQPATKAPGAPAASPATPGQGVDRAAVTRRLLDLVSQRTGYPPEMLDLDLNLEAELGIDSIKRVEILSGLVASDGFGPEAGKLEMEKLTALKTLREIVDYVSAASEVDAHGSTPAPESQPALEAQTAPDAETSPETQTAPHAQTAPDAETTPRAQTAPPGPEIAAASQPSGQLQRGTIQRMLVRPVAIDPPAAPGQPLPGPLLVTDDGRGVARELIHRMSDNGRVPTLLVRMPGVNGSAASEGSLAADLTDPEAVEQLLSRAGAQTGGIAGLVHLLPLAQSTGGDWKLRIDREVKSLFLLARALARQQRQTRSTPRLLLAATAMGGGFGAGLAPLPADFFPGQGGVAGLVKSLAHEWPEALVRVVDFDARRSPAELAQMLLAELHDASAPVEVGHLDGQRVTLECDAAGFEHTDGWTPLEPGSTLLVTGGARGITAAATLELARRYRPRLALVGQSPLPPENEWPETAGLDEPARLRAALIELLRREGRPSGPGEVERAYRRVVKEREIRANLAALRACGAEVAYFAADARDRQALGEVIRRVEERFGAIDGVIHGAGVIDDRLIGDKTVESFEYVFHTKLQSALNLSELLDPERLRFCAFFASVAGRFGNRGQSDYAAANEVLSKLAAWLDQRWPGRVVSVVWGPWSQIGMVSELEQHLMSRGLELIPPDVGPLRFEEELRCGRKGEYEVVIAGDVGQLGRRHSTAMAQAVVRS